MDSQRCDVTKPCLLKSFDFVSLIRAPNHWFKTNDSQTFRSLTKHCFKSTHPSLTTAQNTLATAWQHPGNHHHPSMIVLVTCTGNYLVIFFYIWTNGRILFGMCCWLQHVSLFMQSESGRGTREGVAVALLVAVRSGTAGVKTEAVTAEESAAAVESVRAETTGAAPEIIRNTGDCRQHTTPACHRPSQPQQHLLILTPLRFFVVCCL